MLTFNKGSVPIGIIKGGELNGHLIFINNPNNKTKEQIKEIVIPDCGNIIPFPSPYKTSRMYTGGPTGSGKSTSLGSWIKQYEKTHPGNPIYLFKKDDDFDPAFGGIDMEEKVSNEYQLNDFDDSLLVFDDIDGIEDPIKKFATHHFMIDALKNGRKKGISVCCSNQFIYDGKKTKNQLYQCDKIIVFPGSSNYQIENLCKKYIGMNKSGFEKLIRLPSRWVLISKNYPQYIMHEKGAYII